MRRPPRRLSQVAVIIGVFLVLGCSPRTLGVNLGNPEEGARRQLYPVARLLDLLDMVTVNASVGWGIAAEVHATQAFSAGLGSRSHLIRLGQDRYPRRWIAGVGTDLEMHLLPFALGYTSNVTPFNSYTWNYPPLKRPSSRVFQQHRDYWAIGASVFVAVAGAEAEIHPLQIGDFFAGWLLFDPLNDDRLGAHDRPSRLPEDWDRDPAD